MARAADLMQFEDSNDQLAEYLSGILAKRQSGAERLARSQKKDQLEKDTNIQAAGLQGAATGAGIGTMFGGIGGVVGGIAGGVIGTGAGMIRDYQARRKAGQKGVGMNVANDLLNPVNATRGLYNGIVNTPGGIENALTAGKGISSSFKKDSNAASKSNMDTLIRGMNSDTKTGGYSNEELNSQAFNTAEASLYHYNAQGQLVDENEKPVGMPYSF